MVSAGARSMAGWPGRSTAFASSVAAASASAALAARTVTESAIPSDRLRPERPEVAIPPIPSPAFSRTVPRSVLSCADILACAICPPERCTAISPPLLTKARVSGAEAVMVSRISSATAPATAAIGVMNVSAAWRRTALVMREATRPCISVSGSAGRRSSASSSTISVSTVAKRPAAAVNAVSTANSLPSAETMTSMGPCWR